MRITLAYPEGMIVNILPEDKKVCKEYTCQKEIYWTTNPKTGKRMPVSQDINGNWVEHHRNCTKPEKFRSQKPKQGPTQQTLI